MKRGIVIKQVSGHGYWKTILLYDGCTIPVGINPTLKTTANKRAKRWSKLFGCEYIKTIFRNGSTTLTMLNNWETVEETNPITRGICDETKGQPT